MGGVISAKFLVVLVIALVVLGPEKLPDAARTIGRVIAEFRRITTGLQQEVREAFDSSDLAAPMQDLAAPIHEWRATTQTLRGTATSCLTGSPSPGAPAGSSPPRPAAEQGAPISGSGTAAPVRPAIGGWRPPADGELAVPPGDPSLN